MRDFNAKHGPPPVRRLAERRQAIGRRHAELEQAHAEMQELIAAMDATRTVENRRMAHELHDDFGQLLAAMQIDLALLQRRLPVGDAKAAECLDRMRGVLDAMSLSVRRIIADLPPKVLDDLDLPHAIQALASDFEQRHSVLCTLSLPAQFPDAGLRITTTIFRVVQEALNNVAKHARAGLVEVTLDSTVDIITLCIRDDGVGLPKRRRAPPGSLGLKGMHERIAALDGEMVIDCPASGGTVICISIPFSDWRKT
jgi:two-component system, NarL family, sensor histidine kinase UhpB